MGNLIVKDNALINASYNLSLVEQRLVLLAIIEARESGRGISADSCLTIHAESYINQFGVHRNTAYQALKDACKDLFSRQFSYQELTARGNSKQVISRWVSQIAYNDNEASIELIFAPAVVPLITKLEQHFTKYDIDQVSNLSSAYAVRLYELLVQWRTKNKTPTIGIIELRQKLGVLDTEYLRADNFKRRVLTVAVNQINQHTDITVKYEQEKIGKSISGYCFTFKPKQQLVQNKKMDRNTRDIFRGLSAKQVKYFASKLTTDGVFASQFAQAGEQQQDFELRIEREILESSKYQQFLPYLRRLGIVSN